MPTLDWLDRQAAFQTAARVPTRVLRPHAAGQGWADRSGGTAVFAMLFKQERGMELA